MATKTNSNKETNTGNEANVNLADVTTGNEANVNLADVTKEVEEILANAKAEAEKIIANAKASVSGELTEEKKAELEKEKAYYNELVEVRLFKDNNKYRDDVYVAVNGENCVIKRGVSVKIKRKFALVLENSDMQDYETSMLIEEKSKDFAKSEL